MIREFLNRGSRDFVRLIMRSGTPVAGFFASLVSNSCTEIGEVALEIVIVPVGEFHGFQKISG